MSLSAWMGDREFEWRQRLAPVSLVIETDFTEHEIREAQKRYGATARQLAIRGWTYQRIIQRFPALTTAVLVGHAALEYDHGAYWDSFWTELGMPRDADFENDLRRSFVGLLDKFALARFPDIESDRARKYVMMFALHAGIPVHSLGDLLELINDHIRQGRIARGAAIMEWLEEPGKEHRGASLDVPVRNFLTNGAEFAADILDRIIEFVEAITADPSLLDLKLDASTTGLPRVLLDDLIVRLRQSPVHIKRQQVSARRSTSPAIVLNTEDVEVDIALPPFDGHQDAAWSVAFDGDVRTVYSQRRWGSDAQTATLFAIPKPVNEVVASHPELRTYALPLVLETDPLLTFDSSGRWVPRKDALKDAVWALYPSDHDLIDPHTSLPIACSDAGAPAGWSGWRSVFVELDEVHALQLRRGENHIGTRRWVRKDARPTFDLGHAVVGLLTMDGRTVYASRPWVMLPASTSEPAAEWTVRVRRLGDDTWIASEVWTAEAEVTSVDPFDDDEEYQLGLFEIVVTGPLGSDARCVMFLAEGVESSFDTPIRVPEEGGLTPCVGEVLTEGLSVTPNHAIRFGNRDLDIRVEVADSTRRIESIVLRPPHIKIRTGIAGLPAGWRMTADVCDPDEFAEDRFVEVRATEVGAVRFSYVSPQGDHLQLDAHPRRRNGDIVETRTQQFADTARAHPRGRIIATLTYGSKVIDVPVLLAQPRRLASNVRLVDDRLEFADLADVDDLAVRVLSLTAPWSSAETLQLVGHVAKLPGHLVDAGELYCELFIDDPWVFAEQPSAIGQNGFRVAQLGWREDGTESQTRLARYLAGVGRPPTAVGAESEVWGALARLHDDGKVDRFTDLIVLLDGDPRAALESLGLSSIDAGHKMATLIRSELVNLNFAAEYTFNELHPHPWFGCMVELADLPSLYQRRAEVREERIETLSYLCDRGGAPLMQLLRTGNAACVEDACFDANVLAMSNVSDAQLMTKLNELAPRAQLHPEAQRVAVYEAFRRRTEWMETGWSTSFAQQVAFVIQPIKRVSPRAAAAIAMRAGHLKKIDVNEHPWMLMSLQSLTLAFLARLEAHGRIGGQYLNRGLLRQWADFAQLCPTMVANDLLIAEAVVLFDRRGDLTGEDQ